LLHAHLLQDDIEGLDLLRSKLLLWDRMQTLGKTATAWPHWGLESKKWMQETIQHLLMLRSLNMIRPQSHSTRAPSRSKLSKLTMQVTFAVT